MPKPEVLPTRQERASRALKNAISRADKHLLKDDVEAAKKALRGGMATSRQWLDGTHPQMDRASN